MRSAGKVVDHTVSVALGMGCAVGCIVSLESSGAHDITWRGYVKRQYLAKFSRINVFSIGTRSQKRSSFLQNYLFFLENIL